MAISTGARSEVGMVSEVSWGVTPASPALTGLPFTTFNINLTRDEYEDLSVRADRQQRYSISGNRHVAGEIDVNMSANNFDGLLESLLASTFTTNVLKVGATEKSFTVEHAARDIGQFNTFTGVKVDKMSLTVPSSGVVTGKFSVIGKDSAYAPSSVDADAYTTPTAVVPFTHLGGTFTEGGSAIGTITSVSVSVDNGYQANFSLGNSAAHGLTYNFVKVTGTVTAYFEDAALLTKFLSGTSSSLQFTLTDGTVSHTYLIPKVKYTGATKQVSGQGPIVITLPFKGLYDTTAGSAIVITRT